MSADPNLPAEPTPQPPEAEWTDDINPSMPSTTASESVSSSPVTEGGTPTDEWEESLDWENEPIQSPPPEPVPMSTREALAWLRPLWLKGLASWRRILAGIRARIPAAAQLSDAILSTILIASFVLLLTILTGIRQPSRATEQPPETVPPAATDVPNETTPAPLNSDEPSEPELDPAERDRMAQIQAQLTDSSPTTNSGLVESVEADFQHNALTVNLGSGWYRLSAYEQAELANSLMQQSRQTAFEDLQLRSPDGDVLARSPVIGNEMVILQREKPPAVELPPSTP